MKNKKIILSSILAIGVLGGVVGIARFAEPVNAATNKTIYFSDEGYLTNKVDWIWSWKSGGNGASYALTDSDSDGIFEATIPSTNDWLIFASGTSVGNWGQQTGDIKIPTDLEKPFYTLSKDGSGMWSEFGEQIPVETYVESLINKYISDGRYVRDTEIYLNSTAVTELLALDNGFHAKASELVRKTYFDKHQLWMTGNDINSGYGTNANGEMNHFTFKNGSKDVDYTVSGSTGMEDWYQTLNDFSVSESQKWVENGTKYVSSDSGLIEWYKAFTAPCYKGFKKDMSNYINFDHVEIEETANGLEFRLYASSINSGSLTSSGGLFSKATVTHLNTNVAIAGSFNGWNSNYDLIPTDKNGVYYTEIELTAQTYEMKVVYNDAWYGNNYAYKLGDAFDFWGDNNSNCSLKITTAGKYAFSIDTNGTYPKLTINQIQ